MEVENQLERLAEDSTYSMDDLWDLYEEKKGKVQNNSEEELSESQLQTFAMSMVRSKYSEELSSSGATSSDEVNIISLGHGGVRSWQDGDVFIGYGVVQPSDEPAHKGAIIFEEDDHYFEELKGKFTGLQRLSGEFNWSLSGDMADTYILNATSATEVVEEESNMSLQERREWVNENHITDQAEIANIMDHLSMSGDEAGFAGTLGADIKRIQGTISDYWYSEESNVGQYIILDDSVVDPRDYPDEVTEQGDRQVHGLGAWVPPEKMDYGKESICDFYGSISSMDDGTIVMNIYSIVPLPGMATEIDLTTESETATTSSDIAEETKI